MPDPNDAKPPANQPKGPSPIRSMLIGLGLASVVVFWVMPALMGTPSNSTNKPTPTPSPSPVAVSPSPNPPPGTPPDGTDPNKFTFTCEAGQVPTVSWAPNTGWMGKCTTPPPSLESRIVSNLLNWGLPIGILGWIVWSRLRASKAAKSGGVFAMLGLGKKFTPALIPETRFKDVAGVDDAREELETIVEMLKFPEKFKAMGARVVRGALLNGPPGTGKTLLARAVAGEAQIPFFPIAASELVEGIVGFGAAKVRTLFAQAKAFPVAMIFIDELDAVGAKRSSTGGFGGHDEREQTLNQILTEMDGFDDKTRVIVLAATNRKELLDAALLRPGRFTRHVDFYKPDQVGRRAVIDVHKVGKKLATGDKTFVDPASNQNVTWHAADLDKLARDTTGAVGADLAEILNDAAILAVRRKKDAIYQEELDEAVMRAVMGGARKSQVYDAETKELVAVHESGHVLAALFAPKSIAVSKVSILGRGEAGGVTFFDVADKKFYTEDELLSRMVGAYGGRAAEREILGAVTQGASNDLQNIRHIAEEMVMNFGMSEQFSDIAFPKPEQFAQKGYSDGTQDQIDQAITDLSHKAMAIAAQIMKDHRGQLLELKEALKKDETLGQVEIMKIVSLDLGKDGPEVVA